MQKGRHGKLQRFALSVCVALLLASSSISASPSPASHATLETEAFPPSLSPEEAPAFSNTTANGVRREGIDTALHKYAFMTLLQARPGIIYNVSLPPFLDGILCQAMLVDVESAGKKGLLFNEFDIPPGMVVQTAGPFLIMVYRKIRNFTLYSAPPGYAFASPVAGIVAYPNLNTSLDGSLLPEMIVGSPNTSITAKLPMSNNIPLNATACAFYNIDGIASVTNISSYPNICSCKILTDVGLIVPESAIADLKPRPVLTHGSASSSPSKHTSNLRRVVDVAVVGGVVGLALLIAIILMGLKAKDECQMTRVDEPLEDDGTLQTSLIGHTRAPTAVGVRTRPMLETGSLRT